MNDLVQATFDYSVLDEAKRVRVQVKAESIKARMRRTAEDIIAIGLDLLEVKEELGHGQFLEWINAEFEMSERSARDFMNIARRFGDKSARRADLGMYILRELASPSTPDSIIEQVQSGEIPPTLNAIKEAKEAERQARAQTEIAQRQLFQSQSQTETLTRQIEDLQRQINTISRPQVQIKEVEKRIIPPEMTAQLEALQKKVATLTGQRDNLAREAEKLSVVAREAAIKDQVRVNEERIRKQWRVTCTEFNQSVLKLLSQFPTPIDTQLFDADDWNYLSQAKETARRFLEECNNLSNQTRNMIIDAG